MDDREAVKQRADIVSVVERSVPLQRAGRTLKACCPFHQEKTPSFVVNPERQTWHCFGACATGGDVFSFIMRRDNLSFGEALQQLAAEVGVELSGSRGSAGAREASNRLVAAHEAALGFYRRRLLQAPDAAAARAYVEERGVDTLTGEEFALGYAPDSYHALHEYLTGQGFSVEELLHAGLLSEGEQGAYDRFRNRLMFPIRDERGRPIGFGGRVIGEGRPKYLNSPQTDLFDKSGVLYALDRASEAIRKAGFVVVVEGYMDAITAHQYGIRNVVATLGTALTERHVNLLKRYTRRVTLAMDADAAGVEAMSRGLAVIDRLTANDPDAPVEAVVDWNGVVRLHAVAPVDVHVFTVPQGKDPDEAIRADPAAFTHLAEQAVPPFEFRLRHELAAMDRTDPRARLALADRLLPVVAAVTDRALQAHYLQKVAMATGLREEDLRARLAESVGRTATSRPLRLTDGTERPGRFERRKDRERSKDREWSAPRSDDGMALTAAEIPADTPTAPAYGPGAGMPKGEIFCLHYLYQYEGLRGDGMWIEEELFSDAAARELFRLWRTLPSLSTAELALDEALRPLWERVMTERIPPLPEEEQQRKALGDIVRRLRQRRMEEQKRLLAAVLQEVESEAGIGALVEEAHAALARGGLDEGSSEAVQRVLADLEVGRRMHQGEAALRGKPLG